MNRYVYVLAIVAVFFSACSEAEPLGTKEALQDRVLGKADAPVTIIEYSSLGCPHCAKFHTETLPDIKKNYIDTGKVKLIYRDFPIGNAAYAAAMMARCANPQRYFQFVDVLFTNQDSWTRSQDPSKALARIGKLGGMSQNDFDKCLKNEDLFKGLRKVQLDATEKHDVNATPSFIIRRADNSLVEKISGAQPYDTFEKAIKKAMP